MTEAMRHVRQPVVAGRFYEAGPGQLEQHARRLIATEPPTDLPPQLVGALTPHAGWICSGRLAGLALRALADRTDAATVFITGSVHTVDLEAPALDAADAWSTPLGEVPVDQPLREALGQQLGFHEVDPAHRHEHALEVELPLMQLLWGERLRIVPCMIPPSPEAPAWGEALGALLREWPEPVALVASSDLTHYGPNYGFTPAGLGERGRRWAMDQNDRPLLDRMADLDPQGALSQATQRHSACGGGAIAAVLAAAREIGATAGYLLEHTDSTGELEALGYHDPNNSVGYAAMVCG